MKNEKLTQLLPDLAILAGFSALISGIYLQFGATAALILGGLMSMGAGIYPYAKR